MNRGLMFKAAHELLAATLFCGAMLFVMESLLAYVLPLFEDQFSEGFMQIRFLQRFVAAMLGSDVAEGLGPEMFLALPWAHPVILALVWAHAVICCTRIPAGEIDRGTADVLLGLPVGRWEILVSDTAVWLLAAVIVLTMTYLGNLLGASLVDDSTQASTSTTLIVLLNLFAMYLVVGGLSWLVSSLSDRRGRAMTVVFVVLVASFLLNYLAQMWKPADRVSFMSLLAYYRPLIVFRDGSFPTHDLTVLFTAAALLWLAAGLVFARRDIRTT